MDITFFWLVIPWSLLDGYQHFDHSDECYFSHAPVFYHKGGGSRFFQITGAVPPNYLASHPRTAHSHSEILFYK